MYRPICYHYTIIVSRITFVGTRAQRARAEAADRRWRDTTTQVSRRACGNSRTAASPTVTPY